MNRRQRAFQLFFDFYFGLTAAILAIGGAMVFVGEMPVPLSHNQITGLVIFLAAAAVIQYWNKIRESVTAEKPINEKP